MKHANISIFVPHAGCPNTCSFCNQKVISGKTVCPSAKDVIDICTKAKKDLGDRSKNSEIAFFGGSFTAIPREYMITLLEAVYPFIADETFSGIRISTRPDCIDNQVLEVLKKYGVTSIELGAQSMRDTVLELNDRGHTASQVEQASRLIKQKGFELGLQMMTHLYGDNDDGAIYTANRFVEIKPDTVRIYPTVILKGTKLAQLYNSGEYTVPDINKAVQLIVKLIDIFNNAGIKIIKLGLHASDDVEKEMVGGLYHPAFRELCESEMFFLKAMDIILNENIFGKVIIKVNPKDLSKMIGQKRKNIDKFKQKGYVVKIVADNSVLYNDIKVEKEG